MSSSLQQWGERWIREVTEGGTVAARIRLTSEGQTWQTWERPFLKPEEWAVEAEAMLAQLCEELPMRKIGMMFTAEENAGGVLSQFPKSIMGKNKAAAEIGTQAGAKALAEGFASLAQTVDAVLKIARDQMNQQSLRIDSDQEEIRALHELARAQREAEAVEKETNNDLKQMLVSQLQSAGPLAMEAVGIWMKNRDRAQQAAAAAAAAGAGAGVGAAVGNAAVAAGRSLVADAANAVAEAVITKTPTGAA